MKELISRLKAHDIHLSVNNGDLKVKFKGASLPAVFFKEIKDNKNQIIDYLNSISDVVVPKYILNIQYDKSGYPLSSSQRRLWILSQFEEGNIAYNIPRAYFFEGSFDRSALDYAFKSLLDRHEILRTVFRQDDSGEVRQVVLSSEELGFQIRYLDLQDEREQEDVVWGIVHSDW
ncbi:condensation domain-containing protein, partial [Pedobacter jeongneungensis]|uniref:condensation domain-containing protein n=1 Tax=Pedobacter jeongneungensis TaxID=947309 RepID=UPI0031EFBA8F